MVFYEFISGNTKSRLGVKVLRDNRSALVPSFANKTNPPARSNPFDADRHWDDHGSPFMRALTEPLRPQPAPKPLPAKLRNVAPGLAGFAEATALLP